jgi:RNA polymerase sigma-70 factor, ECF subfamily
MEYERFASLVGPHTDAMAHAAAALVGMADAEDAAQEALLRAWRAWPTLREAGAVRMWLLRITTNVCRNWQTGHFGTHRRATQSLDAAASRALLLHTGAPGPGSRDHADALDLQRAVAALSDDLRHVVALRFFAEMDATEIGDLLDTPPATIRTRLRRALTLLRDALGPAPCDDAAASGVSTQSDDSGRSGRSAQAQLERGA